MDIVGSRKVKDRRQLQINLDNYIAHVSKKYKDILVAPIAVTLGDEWQLITNRPSECYNLVHEFQKSLWRDGLELYAGIGIGELSTPISDDIRKMDGLCFHIARDAIKIAKNIGKLKNKFSINKLNKVFLLTRPMMKDEFDFDILSFYFKYNAVVPETVIEEIAAVKESNAEYNKNSSFLNSKIIDKTINLIIENNEILKAKMTRKQREIYIYYSNLGSYRKVIDALKGIERETIGGISQKLNNASYFTIQRNHEVVALLLDNYCMGM